MGTKPLKNYLRMHRKRSALTQTELASLLGCGSGAKISVYERCLRQPSMEVALAYCLVFGLPIEDLFAGDARRIHEGIVVRSRFLLGKISRLPASPLNDQKKILLGQLVEKVGLHRRHKSSSK